MDTVNLVDSFREFKELKNIDRETMMGILEEVFRNMIIKKYGADDNFDIIINPKRVTSKFGTTAKSSKTVRSKIPLLKSGLLTL